MDKFLSYNINTEQLIRLYTQLNIGLEFDKLISIDSQANYEISPVN